MPNVDDDPRILALLQNQWFPDPERIPRVLAYYQEKKGEEAGRHRFVRDMLFLGCLTGRRIREAFGEDMLEYFTFEEVSPKIGDHPGASFPPDIDHLTKTFKFVRPELIVAFGRIAQAGVDVLRGGSEWDDPDVIICPHPAARGPRTMPDLAAAADEVRTWLGKRGVYA